MDTPPKRAIVFTVIGVIGRADVTGLCDDLRGALGHADADTVICDVGAVVRPDAVTVDALARLQLTAQRLGYRLRLRNASPELRELISFMGLRPALP